MKLFRELPEQAENPHEAQRPHGCLHFPNYYKLHQRACNHDRNNIIQKPGISDFAKKVVKTHHHRSKAQSNAQSNMAPLNEKHEEILRIYHHANKLEGTDNDPLDGEDGVGVAEDHLEVDGDNEDEDFDGAGEQIVGEGQVFAVLNIPGESQHKKQSYDSGNHNSISRQSEYVIVLADLAEKDVCLPLLLHHFAALVVVIDNIEIHDNL